MTMTWFVLPRWQNTNTLPLTRSHSSELGAPGLTARPPHLWQTLKHNDVEREERDLVVKRGKFCDSSTCASGNKNSTKNTITRLLFLFSSVFFTRTFIHPAVANKLHNKGQFYTLIYIFILYFCLLYPSSYSQPSRACI